MPIQTGLGEREVDRLAVRGRGEPERPARRKLVDGLDRAGEERQRLAVGGENPLQHLLGDLVGLEVDTELLGDVPRPLRRALALHVARRRIGPGATALADQLPPGRVPGPLGVEQDSVHVEDDGFDHVSMGRRQSGLPASLSQHLVRA